MKLILISGAEATCKSDIGKRLSNELGYIYQSKDLIKEAMYDKGEQSTWKYGWYESQAKQVFFNDIAKLIHDKSDAIIESNFIGEDRTRLARLINENVLLKEIHCYADGLHSFKRAVRRNESGSRHSGHHDRRWYPKIFIQSFLHAVGIDLGAHKHIGITDDVLMLNTTEYPNVDFEEIVEFAK